jgi:hypothetical protein
MNESTVLLRQIHPSFIRNERPTSQAFRPTPKDQNLLSVYDGDMIIPEHAWQHFIRQPNCRSVGVMGVTVEECSDLKLSTRPDPEPFPEHEVIDFSAHSKSQCEKKAKHLRAKADERDWLYCEAAHS